jgi:hypothetical protein
MGQLGQGLLIGTTGTRAFDVLLEQGLLTGTTGTRAFDWDNWDKGF